MGLSFLNSGVTRTADYERTTTRSKFRRVIEEAILLSKLDECHPTLANKLRMVGETAPRIATNGWKLRNRSHSLVCGCPLTEAGVVSIDNEDGDWDRNPDRRKAAESFFLNFDINMGGGKSAIHTIIDD